LDVPDAHAGMKERVDQAGPLEHLQHRWLEGGTASLVMRRESALHNPRPDAVAEEFAGREQSSRTSPHDQDGRCACGPMIFTKLFVERGANVANARIDVGHGLYIPVGATEHMPCGSGRSRSSPAIVRVAKSSPIDNGIVNLLR